MAPVLDLCRRKPSTYACMTLVHPLPGRTDYQDLNWRMNWKGQQKNQWPEWIWQGSQSLGSSAQVFAGQLGSGGYGTHMGWDGMVRARNALGNHLDALNDRGWAAPSRHRGFTQRCGSVLGRSLRSLDVYILACARNIQCSFDVPSMLTFIVRLLLSAGRCHSRRPGTTRLQP